MKRDLRSAMALLLAISLSLTPVAGQVFAASGIQAGAAAGSAAILQDTLYALADGKLLSYAADGESPTVVLDLSVLPQPDGAFPDSFFLAADDASLYLIGSFNGIVYEIKNNRPVEKTRLDMSSLGRENEDGSRYIILSHPVVLQDQLYLLHTAPETYAVGLYRFSLATGQREPLHAGNAYIGGLYRYKAGKLLVLDLNTGNLLVLEPGTGNAVSSLGALSGADDGAVAYDQTQDRLYFLSGSRVMRWSHDGRHQTIGALPEARAVDVQYAGMWKENYTILTSKGIHTYNVRSKASTAAAPKTTLTLWSQASGVMDTEAFTRFMLANPDTALRTIGSGDEDPFERLTFANLSQDPDIDIFIIPSYLGDSHAIFRRGYAAPIASPALTERVLSMYPQVKDHVMLDGSLFAYPVELHPSFWSIRQDLLRETGLGELPATYDEYIDQMLDWYERFYADHPSCTFDGSQTIRSQQENAVALLMAQYIARHAEQEAPVSFNTPEIQRAIEKIATLSRYQSMEWTIAQDAETAFVPSIFDPKATSCFLRRLNPERLGEAFMLPPVVSSGDQPVLGASLDYFIVNPYSRHREAAVRFIEFYSENMPLVSRYMLYPAFNEPVEQESYRKDAAAHAERIALLEARIEENEAKIEKYKGSPAEATLREELYGLQDQLVREQAAQAQTEKGRYQYLPEEIDEYRRVAPYMQIKNGWLVTSVLQKTDAAAIVAKYFEGTMSIDRALKEVDRRVAAMYYEGQ